jgi:biopolymer transport protein ExbD/biopolymer transport protein TolR
MRAAERIAQRKHVEGPTSDINVTPLVDVVLVLLIIFMVITPMLNDDVILPKARFHKRQPKEDSEKITLVIERDKRLRIEKDVIDRKEIKEVLKQKYANKADKSLFLKADQSLKWGEVMKVMDLAREGTVEEISLVTDDYPEGE